MLHPSARLLLHCGGVFWGQRTDVKAEPQGIPPLVREFASPWPVRRALLRRSYT